MATNANLPAGAFITSLGGKRCTAIPKRNGGGNGGGDQQQTATSTTQAQASSAPPPPPPPAETTTTEAQQTTTEAQQTTTEAQQTTTEAQQTTTAAQQTTTEAQQTTTAAQQTTPTTQPQETTTTAQAEQPPPAAAPIRTTTAVPPPPPQETTTQETSTPTSTTSPTTVVATTQAPPPPPPPPPAETSTPGTPTPETPAAPAPTSPTTSPLPQVSTEQPPPPSPTTQAPTPPQPTPQDPPGSTAPNAPAPESSTVRSIEAPVLAPAPSSRVESQVQTSQAEQPDTATQDPQTQTADSSVPAITGPPSSLVTSNLDSATGGAGLANGVVLTTDGTRVLTLNPAAASSNSGSLDKGALNGGGSDGGSSGATSSQTNIAIVAGVLGGLAFVLLVGFIFWFVRRRMRRDRRSTLLTPLGPEQGFGNMEKRPYFISRDSIGPTPLSEKFRATVGVNFKKIRSRVTSIVAARSNSPSPSVNLDRGNSQFLDGPIGSNADSRGGGGSAKDRFLGFFGRGRGRPPARDSGDDPFINTRGMKDTRKRPGSQPDFLTLLNMDDQQLAAQTRRKSVAGKRRSTSAGSSDHFLGGLGLGFDSRDPFSDANEMTRASAKVPPLGVAKANPFSDANAIQPPTQSRPPGPSTYVETMRHSRGQSMGGSRPPSAGATHTRNASLYRESLASVESFETRRNKFRSDPFDLDRPELLSASVTSSALGAFPGRRDSREGAAPRLPPPGRAHVRDDSYGSSTYSSSAGGGPGDYLGDPGPDVGPAVARNNAAPSPLKRKSQSSVGKAL